MKIRPLLLLILCSLPAAWSRAEIYESRDEQGNVIYTDVPPKEDAAEVKLPPVNILDAPDRLNSQSSPASKKEEYKYQELSIVSPANNDTIYINTASISIQIKLSPEVNRGVGHNLELLWDGQVLARNQMSYQVTQADRGEHVIQARVVDANKQVLISASPVTVNVKQPFTP
ncbi:MAG TPA: DUF4124 domain-containing protein [Gammaproteobacteria bacterium]|nr:DUF4124 domain-containing protein [Gammaproteobacteria bacterium]